MVFERGRVGTGSVLALDAVGKQDTYLHNEKIEDSRWDPTYTQTSNFAITQRTVTLPGTNWIDHEIKVELIPKSCGDMISNMHLQCSLPPLPPGNVYTDQVGRALIKQIDFMIDGQIIESLNDDWYIIRDQLFLDADEKNAMAKVVNGGYSEGTLSLQTNTPKIDMIIPLDFFFCRRHSRYKKHRERLDRPYFPTCAVYNQKIYVNFKFQPWSWFSNSIADARIGNITMNQPLVIYNTTINKALTTGDTNVYVNDDISFWPNQNGSITIDSETMRYTNKDGQLLTGLRRLNRTTHSNGAPVTLNGSVVYYSAIAPNVITTTASNIYLSGDLSQWPAANGIITISNEELIYGTLNNNLVSNLYRPDPSPNSYPANTIVTLSVTKQSGYTYTSNVTMYPVSNCVPGMYIYGIPTLGTGKAVINSIDSANNILNITYSNIIPTSQTYTLTFSFSTISKTLTLPASYVYANDHHTFVFDSSSNIYPGMQMNGTDVVGGQMYIRGRPVIASNNINKFMATNTSATLSSSNTIVSFTINNTVPYLTTGNTYVNFPNSIFGILTNINGSTLTANILGNQTQLNGFNGNVSIDSPPIVGNYVTINYPWQEPVINTYGGSMLVNFTDETVRKVTVPFSSPIDMSTTSNVVIINDKVGIMVGMNVVGMPAIEGYSYVSAIDDNEYTITYPAQNQITVNFPFTSFDSNIIAAGDVTFWPDINGSIRIGSEEMLYGKKIGNLFLGITRSQNMQGYNNVGSNVTVMSLVSESSNNLSNLATSISNLQTVVTLSGNITSWPSTGIVQVGTSEVCPYSGKSGQSITLSRVLPSVAYAQYTNVLLQNTFSLVSTLASDISNTDTLITLSGNIASWPTTGKVLLETSEICTYASKSGQNITLTRGTYARSHSAYSNVILQNTFTTSTIGVAMTAAANTFTLSSTAFALRDWPTNNAMVVVDNETIFYGIRQGNVFSNCFNRNLAWSTHFVGESILNLRAWEFPITIQNLTDFIEPPQLLLEEVQLTEEERQYTKAISRRIVVNHVQKKPPLYFEQGTNGQITIGIGASFPVTFMCWFIRRGDYETLTRYVDSRYSYGYTTKYINAATPITFFNGVKFNYIDLIDNAQITLDGNPILSKLAGGVYFTMKQPFDHALSIPTKSIYIYSFGMNPKEYNQGGFMDFSPLNASTTTLSLEFKPQYATELAKAFSLYLFYFGYTILEVKDGFGRLVFV